MKPIFQFKAHSEEWKVDYIVAQSSYVLGKKYEVYKSVNRLVCHSVTKDFPCRIVKDYILGS